MANCKLSHRYDTIFQNLPESQKFYDKTERHKCAGCAYEQGYNHAKSKMPRNIDLDVLDKSQAGEVRHKDPTIAYNLGYDAGLRPE
ncbi:hypothetical protein ACI6PS_07795 [Flavobacterium sp. PLA-1-15]|uniref:hypothetical protein n=1 Tax=Flavobacterium sp. PLA-1-15 TaxID=3380533 RepID=UPI003B7D465D